MEAEENSCILSGLHLLYPWLRESSRGPGFVLRARLPLSPPVTWLRADMNWNFLFPSWLVALSGIGTDSGTSSEVLMVSPFVLLFSLWPLVNRKHLHCDNYSSLKPVASQGRCLLLKLFMGAMKVSFSFPFCTVSSHWPIQLWSTYSTLHSWLVATSAKFI